MNTYVYFNIVYEDDGVASYNSYHILIGRWQYHFNYYWL